MAHYHKKFIVHRIQKIVNRNSLQHIHLFRKQTTTQLNKTKQQHNKFHFIDWKNQQSFENQHKSGGERRTMCSFVGWPQKTCMISSWWSKLHPMQEREGTPCQKSTKDSIKEFVHLRTKYYTPVGTWLVISYPNSRRYTWFSPGLLLHFN